MSSRARLFFGLWPDAADRERLAVAAGRYLVGHGRAVDAHALHLTLSFLGSLEPAAADEAQAAAGEIRGDSFDLTFERIGHWPRPRIVWCAPVEAPRALYRLQELLAGRLRAHGFQLDGRPFSPHVTLARKCARWRGPDRIEPVCWQLRSFHLLASQTMPGGARYRGIRSFGLQ